MKTGISIPDDLFEAAERTASRLGMTRSELYRRAVGAFVAQHSDQLVTEALDKVYGSNGESLAIDPALDALQSASLGEESW